MLPLLSSKEVTVIFANIEDILLTNTVSSFRSYVCHYKLRFFCFETFLSVLEERQKECRLYMDQIGDILLDHIPNMAVYMVISSSDISCFCSDRFSAGVLRQSIHSNQSAKIVERCESRARSPFTGGLLQI